MIAGGSMKGEPLSGYGDSVLIAELKQARSMIGMLREELKFERGMLFFRALSWFGIGIIFGAIVRSLWR